LTWIKGNAPLAAVISCSSLRLQADYKVTSTLISGECKLMLETGFHMQYLYLIWI